MECENVNKFPLPSLISAGLTSHFFTFDPSFSCMQGSFGRQHWLIVTKSCRIFLFTDPFKIKDPKQSVVHIFDQFGWTAGCQIFLHYIPLKYCWCFILSRPVLWKCFRCFSRSSFFSTSSRKKPCLLKLFLLKKSWKWTKRRRKL